MIEVVPVSRTQAKAFVRQHHRHNSPVAADVIRCGLSIDGQLVGVAMAGMPPRGLMDGRTLAITRLCTLGHENACSRLYGALARAAKALGWQRLYTYTLAEEDGASVKAAGFIFDGVVPAAGYLAKNGSRPRYDTNLLGERLIPESEKYRWRRDLFPAPSEAGDPHRQEQP